MRSERNFKEFLLIRFAVVRSSVFAIEARDFARRFAIGRSLFQIGTFIARHFSLCDRYLRFQLSIFPMQIKKHESAAAHLGFAIKLIDFGAMEQQLTHSFG